MPFTKAGRYNEVLFVDNRLAANTDATILVSGTNTNATLFSNRDKTATLASSVVRSDAAGNLAFFADPGYYDIVVAGKLVSIVTVPLDYASLEGVAVGDFQPLDSDLTAIAALTTTPFGRAFLGLVDAAAGRAHLTLGTAALAATGDFQPNDADLTAIAALATTAFGRSVLTLADAAAGRTLFDAASVAQAKTEVIIIAVGDETTAITTGLAKVTFRMPFAMTLFAGNAGVRASVNTVSSAGIPTVNIKEEGVTIFSTKLTIDATEKSSMTAAIPVVISDTALADDAEITIDIDVAGTGASGLKVVLIGTRA